MSFSIFRSSFLGMCLCGFVSAQSYDVVLEKKSNYKEWGKDWDTVYVVKNNLISIAVLPKIGGRVMEYDLGTHPSMYVHPVNLGIYPVDGNMVIGGFRTLPSPQSDFVWPSPPKLDCEPYTCKVVSSNADSTVLYLESQVENSTETKYKTHKGLQFKRKITLYKASTRVKMELTMLNKGSSTLKHGIWDITQTTCINKDIVDQQNMWVYFQRNPTSTLGGGKGYVQYMHEGTDDSQWKPDAAPGGIMGVQYLQAKGKIGADCRAGWICFVDQLDGYAYAKTFTYESGKEYPDSGASVQVYTYDAMDMLEVEVLGPLTSLAPNDSTKLIENWYAARASGPILSLNSAGLITKKLSAEQNNDSMTIRGTYGLFCTGKIKCSFVNSSGSNVAVVDSLAVNPLDSLSLNKKYRVPAGATTLRLTAYDNSGTMVGVLDTVLIPNPVGVNKSTLLRSSVPKKVDIQLKNSMLQLKLCTEGAFMADVYTADGTLVKKYYGNMTPNKVVYLPAPVANVYLVKVSGAGWSENKIICNPGH